MGGAALRGWVLSPPSRLDSDAELFHGLTPTAKCCRRFAARLEAPGWRFGDGCCRRLRGSTFELPLFHGLTPTAKCCRRLGGLLEPPGWRFGDDPIYSVAPTQLRRLGQEYSPRRCPGDHLFENRCAHGGWWFWRGSGCRARQLVPGDAAASRWVDQLEDAVRVLANKPLHVSVQGPNQAFFQLSVPHVGRANLMVGIPPEQIQARHIALSPNPGPGVHP